MRALVTSFLIIIAQLSISAQELTLSVSPESLKLKVGATAQVDATVTDADGNEVKDVEIFRFSRKGKAVSIDSTGQVKTYLPGNYSLIVIARGTDGKFIRKDIPVEIEYPPLAKILISDVPSQIYAGTTIQLKVKVLDEMDLERKGVKVTTMSSNNDIASIDDYLYLSAQKKGKATITAKVEDIESTVNINVVDNPVTAIELESNAEEGRTGDVFRFKAKAVDKNGNPVEDAPLLFSFTGRSDDVSNSASGLIKQDGRFVADVAGLYTVTASSGPFVARKSLRIYPRNVQRKIELVGQGSVSNKHTSDFWVWEGVDGKDYAVTGTWGADGTAYFWEVTDPANITLIDSIRVDARTVNDVKVSEDGTICVISREGASNRKNGIVILDVKNPRDVSIISEFTENLTGGVHNLYIYKDHVYALSAGRKYYVVNIEDPANPRIVGNFELDTPGHSIHDVWIEDGIAYSSNWSDGLQLVDIGNGIAGGSPENPVQFASYAYPSGANHAAFPYRDKETGKFYVIAGDEIFPYGLDPSGRRPNYAGGFLHVVDFTDLDNPEEIARFEIPGAGSHNFWVEGDLLYAAFYNGGVRVIDLSGELMGDLFKQGREIAWIIPADPDGYVANAPFTWGAQPYKGHIFYSDWNSGLWSAKLEPVVPKDTKVETK